MKSLLLYQKKAAIKKLTLFPKIYFTPYSQKIKFNVGVGKLEINREFTSSRSILEIKE